MNTVTTDLLDLIAEDELASQVLEARRLRLQHDGAFYGPMKDATCGCDLCDWLRRFLAVAAALARIREREAARQRADQVARSYFKGALDNMERAFNAFAEADAQTSYHEGETAGEETE